LETGGVTEEYLFELLGRLAGRTNEIYLHPGTKHARPIPGRPDTDAELEALISPLIRQRIRDLGLTLTTYSGIESSDGGTPGDGAHQVSALWRGQS
jgi:hypothetical protein